MKLRHRELPFFSNKPSTARHDARHVDRSDDGDNGDVRTHHLRFSLKAAVFLAFWIFTILVNHNISNSFGEYVTHQMCHQNGGVGTSWAVPGVVKEEEL